jgi:competence protein ComEA|uniref:Helix-hairpin-helix DNA-binding motif class 1 domain-containing protein n=1 Tax=Desulfobacca acetoxidans TaxID=60893 RepID=A0A7C3WQ51_9BACT
MSLPCFSRSQIGVTLLLSLGIWFLYAWRANFWLSPSPAGVSRQNPVFIEVTGEVSRPGVYEFSEPPTLLAVLNQAGGPAPAGLGNPTLASGSRVEIDRTGRGQISRMAGAQLLTLGLPIDLNAATQADLEALPGIGPVLAGRIIAHRQSRGPFRRIEDLQQVPGIGPKNLEQIKPYLALNP